MRYGLERQCRMGLIKLRCAEYSSFASHETSVVTEDEG